MINIKKANIPIKVKLPVGEIIKYIETVQLPNKDLPLEAGKFHLLPDLKHELVLIGLFFDNGCLAIFDEKEVRIIDKNRKKIIMIGGRDPLKKLFMLDINENEMTEKEIKLSPIIDFFQQIQYMNTH